MQVQWKIFASSYMGITDDALLSMIGSVGALANGAGRLMWGIFYDWSASFRLSMGLQTAVCAAFIVTLPWIKDFADFGGERATEVALTVWLVFIWLCAGCEYAFLPSCIAETFGSKHAGPIIGVFVMAEPFAMAIMVALSSVEALQSDFQHYCLVIAGFCAASTVLSVLYRPNRIDRKQYLNASFVNMKSYRSVQSS